MKNEKKELIKKFKVVIDDLMDHYEEYTDAEKKQIQEIFQKVAELNTILDKYDIEVKFDWEEYLNLLGQINIPTGEHGKEFFETQYKVNIFPDRLDPLGHTGADKDHFASGHGSPGKGRRKDHGAGRG